MRVSTDGARTGFIEPRLRITACWAASLHPTPYQPWEVELRSIEVDPLVHGNSCSYLPPSCSDLPIPFFTGGVKMSGYRTVCRSRDFGAGTARPTFP